MDLQYALRALHTDKSPLMPSIYQSATLVVHPCFLAGTMYSVYIVLPNVNRVVLEFR